MLDTTTIAPLSSLFVVVPSPKTSHPAALTYCHHIVFYTFVKVMADAVQRTSNSNGSHSRWKWHSLQVSEFHWLTELKEVFLIDLYMQWQMSFCRSDSESEASRCSYWHQRQALVKGRRVFHNGSTPNLHWQYYVLSTMFYREQRCTTRNQRSRDDLYSTRQSDHGLLSQGEDTLGSLRCLPHSQSN
jgi:hypothetical protein